MDCFANRAGLSGRKLSASPSLSSTTSTPLFKPPPPLSSTTSTPLFSYGAPTFFSVLLLRPPRSTRDETSLHLGLVTLPFVAGPAPPVGRLPASPPPEAAAAAPLLLLLLPWKSLNSSPLEAALACIAPLPLVPANAPPLMAEEAAVGSGVGAAAKGSANACTRRKGRDGTGQGRQDKTRPGGLGWVALGLVGGWVE